MLLLLLGGTLVFVVSPALRVLTASPGSTWSKYEISEPSRQSSIGQDQQWTGNTIRRPQDIHIGIGRPKLREVPGSDIHNNRSNPFHDDVAR
ncbi:MAG TPA: hypothetical protein VGR45_04895 [Stellaceae bacterium]|nr:hypothetical protein [Stellaceae bacterium]